MIHYTDSISRSVGSYWFSCIFAGTIVASSLPRLIVPGFASSGWRNRIWTLMRFPLGTSTNRQSRIRHSITGTATEFLSRNKIAREIFTQLMFALRPEFSQRNISTDIDDYIGVFSNTIHISSLSLFMTRIYGYIFHTQNNFSFYSLNFYNIIYSEISLCLSKRIMCLQL